MPGRSTAHHSVAKATNGLFIHWQHVNQSHRLMLEGMIMNNVAQILPRGFVSRRLLAISAIFYKHVKYQTDTGSEKSDSVLQYLPHLYRNYFGVMNQ